MYFKAFYAQRNLSVCTFDMTGCGKSDGQYISLGVHEKDDLSAVIEHLKSLGYRRFGLWGRSMGGATTLLYLSQLKLAQPPIDCAVCDSSFSSLEEVIEHLAEEMGVPPCLLGYAKWRIDRYLKAHHKFSLYQLDIRKSLIDSESY